MTQPTLLPGQSSERTNGNQERYGFSGHQTFPFRYSWLKKAVDAVHEDPNVFRREDAVVIFGVGKNMVESIRHWGLATQVLEEDQRTRRLQISEWGKLLFLEECDPYLEDPGSLWLLHWLLVSNPARAATWYLAFNVYPFPDFRKDTLVTFIDGFADRNQLRANIGTIRRDVDCFIRTYTPSRWTSTEVPEDSFNCPLVELELLELLPDGMTYRFVVGSKPSLPVEVVAGVILSLLGRLGSGRRTVSVHECLYEPLSPGQVFKLDEPTLVEYLDQLESLTGGDVAVDETAGLHQLYVRRPIDGKELIVQYLRARVTP
jgi:hypothetical protein